MIRILLALITLPLLAWILEPFVAFILQARGSFAFYLAETHLVNWLGITAIFSAIALTLVGSIYSYLK